MRSADDMPRSSWVRSCVAMWWALTAATALHLITTLSTSPRVAAADEETLPDPIPVRRVLIPSERVPAELERVKQGVLQQLAREEFEERMKRAGLAREALKQPPRLIESRYRATLTDSALVGSAQWRISNPASGAGILALPSFNLALQKARLQARIDSSDAIIGDLDGKSLGLLVEQPGEYSAYLDWTVRGSPAPGMLRFDLRLPSCALATLELNLPADRIISPRENMLLSGPHAAEAADRRLWRVDFAGQAQLDLEIRPVANPSQGAPLVLATLATRQDLDPDIVRADFDFELEVPHEAVREFLFECDPALRPYEVTVRNLETWEPRVAAGPGQPSLLAVKLRDPFRDSSLPLQVHIRCLAALTGDKPWSSPGMRLQGALPQGEALLLRVNPLVRLENWQSGSFVLTPLSEAEAFPAARPKSGEGWQVLTLTSSALKSSNQVRPSAVVRSQPKEFRTRMLSWWQVGSHAASLTVQVWYDVTQGQLFRLPLTLPPGWEVDRVELNPADLLRNWAVVPENDRPTLMVDLHRPLSASSATRPAAPPARLSVWLRTQRWTVPASGLNLTFPELVPVGAYLREGSLGISVDPLFQVKVNASVPASTAEEKGPWELKGPDYVFPYRGLPVTGSLQLQPRRTLAQARCTSEAVLGAEGASLTAHLLLEPKIGNPDVVDILVTAPTAGAWVWKTERGPNHVRSFQRLRSVEAATQLSFLGIRNPLEAAARVAQPVPQREWWRLTLARPLREPVLLRATFPFHNLNVPANDAAELTWAIPLLLVPSAEPMAGEIVVHLRGVEAISFAARGPVEMPASSIQAKSSVWRSFRHGAAGVELSVHGKAALLAPFAGVAADPVVDRALLAITVEPEGRLLHHYRFQVSHWKQKTFPLRLPGGARCLEAKADGRWIPQLDSAVTEEGAAVIAVPYHAGKPFHQYEIIYELKAPSWKIPIWTVVEAPAPELPVRALSSRRLWRLPPGMMPLHKERFDRLPGPAGLPGLLWEPPARIIDEGKPFELQSPAALLHATLSGLNMNDWAVQQQLNLSDAVAAFHNQARDGRSWTLGESLDYIGFDYLKGKEALAVDVAALRASGLSPATSLRQADKAARKHPPWEELDLVILPCRSAPLLTTRKQMENWLGSERFDTLSQSLETAVQEAVTHGHDRWGRFQSLGEWLADTDASDPVRGASFELGTYDAGLNWTEWQPHAGSNDERLAIVRQDAIPLLGLALTSALAWLVWRVRRWRRWLRLTLLLLWVAMAGLALLWLPESLRGLAWYPSLLALTLALFGYLRTVSILSRRKVSAATTLLALACMPMLTGQTPAPFTVFYLPAPEENAQKQVVLVPPELLKQLDDLSSSGVPGLRHAVLLAAQYEGQVTAAAAEFKAEFRVHAFAEKSSLTLPLGGIQLMPDVLLDGAKAHPQTLEAPREGYTLEIKGQGSHVVILRFSVPLPPGGEDRGIRFSIPEVLQSRLVLELPAGTRFVSTMTGRGRQLVTPELAASAPADKALRLETDLGRVPLVQVRWRQDVKPSPSSTIQVREAYLWRLHPTTSSLLAVLQCTAKQGTPTSLVLDLPEQLEVRNADAARLPTAAADEAVPRLKDWHVTGRGNQRRLHFEFQRPLSGGVQIVAEFMPRQPFGANAVLPLPAPQQARTSEGLLAYQVEGVRAQVAEHLRINGTDAKAFVKSWRGAGMSDPGPNTHAYTFQRGLGGAPYLRLNLSLPAPDLVSVQIVAWSLSARQGNLSVHARLNTASRDLVLVEWEMPASIQGLEISGPDIRGWSRTGTRVQAWLQRPVGSTDIRITGWQPLEETKGKSPSFALRLAPLGVLGTMTQTTHLQIKTAGDLVVTPQALKNLVPTPDVRSSDRELNLLSDQLDIGGTIHVRPLLMRADARSLTLLEVTDNQLTFNTVIDWQVRQGELRSLRVKLQNWPGEEVQVTAPGVIQSREQPRDATSRSWTLILPEGITGNYRLKLSGRIPYPLPAGELKGNLPMPDVSVEGASVQDRWLAVAGSELRAEEPRGLTPVSDAVQVLRAWPAEAERIRRAGSAWKIQGGDWHLRVLAPSAGADASPFRLLLADHEAAVIDGKRWLHQSTYWLHQDAGADLIVILPAGARLQTLFVDGVEIAHLQPGPHRLWLPLAGLGGARVIRLRWYGDTHTERVERPQLTPPLLEGVAPGPAQWTLHVPSGYRMVAREATADNAADQDLRRAAALLQLSTMLAERMRGRIEGPLVSQLTDTQEAFYRCCRQADFRQPTPAAGSVLDLKNRMLLLAKSHGFEDIRARAERQARHFAKPRTADEEKTVDLFDDEDLPAEQGTPTYWQAAAGAPAPLLQVSSLEKQRETRALEWSALFLIVLFAAGCVSFVPRLLYWSRLFWPEQMMLLGYAAALLWGPGWIALFLMLFGVVGRSIVLGQWAMLFFGRLAQLIVPETGSRGA